MLLGTHVSTHTSTIVEGTADGVSLVAIEVAFGLWLGWVRTTVNAATVEVGGFKHIANHVKFVIWRIPRVTGITDVLHALVIET